MKPLTQQIYDHLRSEGNISGIEAAALYRCRDLPKRMSELKQAGVLFKRTMKSDHTGQRYARYEIVRD
jgi:succinate dehydrogenase/fumarate reductase flavoprotein subunit